MEERIKKTMPGLQVEINSYVDDLALTIYDGDGTMKMERMNMARMVSREEKL